uniref:Sodium-dependent glucose transporter 1-like n=1 Tax=Steinernema glaseri TaxID=37863 RepID=A0A1I7Y2Q7_9BILA
MTRLIRKQKDAKWFSLKIAKASSLCEIFHVINVALGLPWHVICAHLARVLYALLIHILGLCLTAISAGFISSLISIAPQYSGTLTAVCSIAGMAGNAFSPGMFGLVAKYSPGNEYSSTMAVTASLSMFSGIFFVFFGSGKYMFLRTLVMPTWIQRKNKDGRSIMDKKCQSALELSQSMSFKLIQGVKILVMAATLVLLFLFFLKMKNNKKIKLIHFNLRFIITVHYGFATANSITLTVMLLTDFTRLARPYEDPCDRLLPFWVTFFTSSTSSLCVFGETLTIAWISLERIMATCIKNYDSKCSKIIPSCVMVALWIRQRLGSSSALAATPDVHQLGYNICSVYVVYFLTMYVFSSRISDILNGKVVSFDQIVCFALIVSQSSSLEGPEESTTNYVTGVESNVSVEFGERDHRCIPLTAVKGYSQRSHGINDTSRRVTLVSSCKAAPRT